MTAMIDRALSSDRSGRAAGLIVYGLYVLSITSAGIAGLLGFAVALFVRGDAGPLARGHLDRQVRIGLTYATWFVVLAVLGAIAHVLKLILIGYPLSWIIGAILFVVTIWFVITSVLGALRLLDDRPA